MDCMCVYSFFGIISLNVEQSHLCRRSRVICAYFYIHIKHNFSMAKESERESVREKKRKKKNNKKR